MTANERGMAMVEVTQEDRDAVKDLFDVVFDKGAPTLTLIECHAQAFARHREAALATAQAEADALRAEVERLRHISTDLLQHIDWLTSGLPAMLEDAALTDEEGLIGAAVDAANSARAALGHPEMLDVAGGPSS
jgi:hypothetical protein